MLGSNRYGADVSLQNSITTLPFFYNTVNNKKWQAEHGNWVSQCARRNSASNWRGRSTLSEAEGVAEPSYKWKGCRELNSDLKVRSLAPSIRWTTSPFVGRRCRTRTDIQSLEGSVLIQLDEAPSYKTWCGMQESNLLRLA